MTPVNFVFFTVGDRYKYHGQLVFCIISILANQPKERSVHFTIVTDKPDFYSWLGERVTIVSIDEHRIAEWKGPHQFFWRVKIEAILEASKQHSGHTIYLDTDTVCFNNLEAMMSCLDQGSNLMHLKEFDFAKTQGGTGKKMKSHGLNKQYGEFVLSESSAMWNAGVVAISEKNNAETTLNNALNACDAMCADNMERKLIEQFSLSLALQANTMTEGKTWFKHYWGNKEQWNEVIADLLAKSLLLNWNLEQAVKEFTTIDLSIPEVIKETKLAKYKNSIKKRLPKL
jgi:lipopolysaccharide biosynthesis glycosyltransferase